MVNTSADRFATSAVPVPDVPDDETTEPDATSGRKWYDYLRGEPSESADIAPTADEAASAQSTPALGAPDPPIEPPGAPAVERAQPSSRKHSEINRPAAMITPALIVPAALPKKLSAADQPAVTIAVDESSNSLIVLGAPRAIERVQSMIEQLQDQLPAPGSRVRVVPMPDGVDARTVTQLITQVLRQVTPANGQRGDIARRAAVVADQQSNAVVITSTDHDFSIIGDLVATFSRPTATDRLAVKVYPLRTITAQRAEEAVRNLLDPDAGRRGRQSQRMRQLALTLMADGATIEAVFDPSSVRVSSDAQNNAVIVMGDASAIAFVDQFVAMIDQTPVNTQSTLKMYPMKAAKASELQSTLRALFQARYRSMRNQRNDGSIQPEFAADNRTNTLLVTASPEQLQEVDQLLVDLDRPLGDERHPLRIVELKVAAADQEARVLEQVVVGSDQDRRASTMIVSDANAGVLMIRAADEVFEEMQIVLKEIDRDASTAFDVRTITLDRADAQAVATAVQRFYDDRARIASSARGRRAQSRRVSIIGDRNSKTLLIAASDDDFEEISQLVAQFDSEQATDALTFRVFQLEHARASEIESTVRDLIEDLTWNQGPMFFMDNRMMGGGAGRGSLAVRSDNRLNALIITGEGDKFEVVQEIIDVLDAPPSEGAERIVKLYPLKNADLDVVEGVVRDIFTEGTTERRWWEPQDLTKPRVRTDKPRNTLIIAASAREHDDIAELIASIDTQTSTSPQNIAVLPLQFADASEIARNLSQFVRTRARATNMPESSASVLANRSANSLIVSASDEDLLMIRDLVTRLDQADISGDRNIEIIALDDGDAEEIARILREQFKRGGGAGVIVTPDNRTNSLIVNAPKQEFEQAVALIDRLDRPKASDETIIRTYALDGAQAREVVDILSQTLQLDTRGETSGITIKLDEDSDAVEVKARIVADKRSNSLIVTATAESIPVIESLISQLDEVPSVSPVEYHIIPLTFAMADDVAFTLERMVRSGDAAERPRIDYNRRENQLVVAASADQFEQIQLIVKELDQPSENERITDFVPLEYAEA
ncbi:MAG: hypothetical protein KC983_06195, partial [Phycisphaerales bacterium]|nr:hypothetical protein [Phycisphaerales bacterium]